MSLLVVGLSHRSAPVRQLEQVAAGVADLPKALHQLCSGQVVGEAVVLSTCNRVEVYAEVGRFHGGVSDITELLAQLAGLPVQELSDALYVYYEDLAVQHLFEVACGLDSMVVGESQILGQLRTAYTVARDAGATGRTVHELFQTALRVGKRAHSETGIDKAGASLVGVGLETGRAALGPLTGRPVLVIGAGSMGALAGAALRRTGVGEIVVANRTAANAQRLAQALGGRGVGLDEVSHELTVADIVISSTGATGVVVPADVVQQALSARAGRPMFFLDLALPRDIDPAVRELPGVTLTNLDALRIVLEQAQAGQDVEAVRQIVAAEVLSFLSAQRAAVVAPTVVALRSQAAELVDAELLRLSGRLPGLDARARTEVEQTVRRVVDKLLHAPTVRVKELAGSPGGDTYAAALRELFGLDRAVAEAVARPGVGVSVAQSNDDLSVIAALDEVAP